MNTVSEPIVFERIMTMSAAFDKRHIDPKKNYGIHGVEIRMVLKGPLGATQFLLFTGWQLPHVTQELMLKHHTASRCCFEPNPADKGYHWSTPQYEGQEAHDCDLLPEGKCYYDGSSLNADDTFKALLEKGSDGVWAELEELYRDLAKDSAAST